MILREMLFLIAAKYHAKGISCRNIPITLLYLLPLPRLKLRALQSTYIPLVRNGAHILVS